MSLESEIPANVQPKAGGSRLQKAASVEELTQRNVDTVQKLEEAARELRTRTDRATATKSKTGRSSRAQIDEGVITDDQLTICSTNSIEISSANGPYSVANFQIQTVS